MFDLREWLRSIVGTHADVDAQAEALAAKAFATWDQFSERDRDYWLAHFRAAATAMQEDDL